MDGTYAIRTPARDGREMTTAAAAVRVPPGFVPRAEQDRATTTTTSSAQQQRAATVATRRAIDAEALAREHSKFRLQKAFQFAQSQLSGIGMMAFMMWMSGNSVQVFSIMATFGGIAQTTKAILNSKATFERFADKYTDVTVPRMMFCSIQVVGLCLALNKLNAMGLLPTHASDWVSGLAPPRAIERAYGGTEL